MEHFTIGIAGILGYLWTIKTNVGSNLITDGLKKILHKAKSPKEFPLIDIFYNAFLDSFKLLQKDVTANKEEKEQSQILLKIFKSYLNYSNKIWLVEIFQKESDYNLEGFLRKVKTDEDNIKIKLSKELLKRFKLIQSDLPEEKIIQLLTNILSYYYDSFLSKMTTEEGQQQLMNSVFQNNELIKEVLSELQDAKFAIQKENQFHNKELSGFNILDEEFWNQTREKTKKKYLPDYYLRTDSKPEFLKGVVASNYYLVNSELRNKFRTILNDAIKPENRYSLIKILAKGGEGKSTFLLDIAKIFRYTYNIIYFDGLQRNQIHNIRNSIIKLLPNFNEDSPIIVLIDNPEAIDDLVGLKNNLFSALQHFHIIFVITERDFRYEKMEGKEDFENGFYFNGTLIYSSKNITKDIGEVFLSKLSFLKENTDTSKLLNHFVKDERKSITERIYSSLINLKQKGVIDYTFDWEDWQSFVKRENKSNQWNNLFTLISIFYQFGVRPTRSFCSNLLEIEAIDLIAELSRNKNLPIYLFGDYLLLRHEKIAQWYLNFNDSKRENRQKEIASILFEKFVENLSTPFSKDLFIWLTKSPELEDNFLLDIIKSKVPKSFHKLPPKKIINHFKLKYLIKYLKVESNKSDFKTLTEIGIIHSKNGDSKEAEKYFLQSLESNHYQIHPRTELGKVYQQLKEWKKAEKVLSDAIELDKANKYTIHTRTELGKVYQQLKEWKKAEKVLSDAIELDKANKYTIHTRTELGKVYQQLKEWKKAEKVLSDAIELEPNAIHSRTELGKVYQQLKEWKKAEKVLSDAIELEPNAIHSRTELGKVYQQLKEWKKAEKVLSDAIELDKANKYTIHTRTELGKVYQQLKEWKKAEKVLSDAIELEPNAIHSRTELGKVYQQLKEWKKAEKVLNEILGLEPDNIHTRTELGKVYQQLKEWKKAEKVLSDAIELEPNAIHSRTELGKVYQQLKKWKKAEKVLSDAIELEPNAIHSRTELGKVYQQLKEWKKAEKVLNEILGLEPDNIHTRTELGKVYQQLKEWKKAEKVLSDAIELEPNAIHSRTELGKVYQQLKKWKKAEKVLSDAIELEPNAIHSRTELGKVYQQLKEWKKAEKVLSDAIELEPNAIHSRTELGKVYQQLKKWKKAEKVLSDAIELDKANKYTIHTRTELGKVYQQLKKWKKAEKVLSDAIELDKANKYTIHTRTELGKVYQQLKKWKKAEKVLSDAIELEPDNLHVRTVLSQVYFRIEDLDKCEAILKEVLNIDSKNIYALNLLAKLYTKQRRFPEREERLFEIYELNPNSTPTLVELAKVFIRYRKYFIANDLLVKAHKISGSNLCIISELLYINRAFKDHTAINNLVKKGRRIIKHNPYAKCLNRFSYFSFDEKSETILIERKIKGQYLDGEIKLENNSRIPLKNDAVINNRIKNDAKIWCSIYRNNSEKKDYANFIEPYYEEIINLKKLK